MVSDEKRVIHVIDSGIGEMPCSPCVQGFDVNGRDEICSSEDDGLGGFRCGSQPLGRLQVSSYVRDKDIVMERSFLPIITYILHIT